MLRDGELRYRVSRHRTDCSLCNAFDDAFVIGRRIVECRVSSRKIERVPFDDRNYSYILSFLSLFFQRPSDYDNFIGRSFRYYWKICYRR